MTLIRKETKLSIRRFEALGLLPDKEDFSYSLGESYSLDFSLVNGVTDLDGVLMLLQGDFYWLRSGCRALAVIQTQAGIQITADPKKALRLFEAYGVPPGWHHCPKCSEICDCARDSEWLGIRGIGCAHQCHIPDYSRFVDVESPFLLQSYL